MYKNYESKTKKNYNYAEYIANHKKPLTKTISMLLQIHANLVSFLHPKLLEFLLNLHLNFCIA